MSNKYADRPETRIDVMAILADPHPQNGEDYAIQLWYRTHRNPRFTVTSKSIDADQEVASLVINGNRLLINIRTGKVTPVLTAAR